MTKVFSRRAAGNIDSQTESSSVSELMNTFNDDPLFDPIVSTDSDYNQSDSQEVVADYDDRSDAAYTSQLAPNLIRIVPNLQQNDEDEMETEYNDNSQIIGEICDRTLVHHSQELESHSSYNSQDVVPDYDDRNEVIESLHRTTLIHQSQNLVLHLSEISQQDEGIGLTYKNIVSSNSGNKDINRNFRTKTKQRTKRKEKRKEEYFRNKQAKIPEQANEDKVNGDV